MKGRLYCDGMNSFARWRTAEYTSSLASLPRHSSSPGHGCPPNYAASEGRTAEGYRAREFIPSNLASYTAKNRRLVPVCNRTFDRYRKKAQALHAFYPETLRNLYKLPDLRNLIQNSQCSVLRTGRACDRASDHQIVRAALDSLSRRHHAPLIPGVDAFGANPRSHD